jgi:hypothetical protein
VAMTQGAGEIGRPGEASGTHHDLIRAGRALNMEHWPRGIGGGFGLHGDASEVFTAR